MNVKRALIVSGDSLIRINADEELKKNFVEVAEIATVVIACRVSPK